MAEMLTAKEIQDLLQVDRSTVYRMAEDGRLPAIKVGKQWRFPAARVEEWFQGQMGSPATAAARKPIIATIPEPNPIQDDLNSLLPLECVQLIQDSFAKALNTMLVVTDMEGHPITTASNPCGLFKAVITGDEALQRCVHSWHDLATMLSLEPQYRKSHLGLLCARSMIRVGAELKGMVVTGCIAPANWPPPANEIAAMAAEFGLDQEIILENLDNVFYLDSVQQTKVISFLPQIANILAHIIDERRRLLGRLQAIAELTSL